jgi:hypothetical protein
LAKESNRALYFEDDFSGLFFQKSPRKRPKEGGLATFKHH